MARGAVTASAPSVTPATRRSERNWKQANQEVTIKKEDPSSPGVPKHSQRTASSATPDRRSKRIKTEHKSPHVQTPPAKRVKAKSSSTPTAVVKPETSSAKTSDHKKTQADKAADLQAKKLKSYAQFANQSPFPSFPHPTPAECELAHRILSSLHGARTRPEKVVAPTNTAGCGNSSSVLDALVRTILSQNTSDKNSSRAKLSMDKVYGGSDKWDAIVEGGQAKLQKTIESGGLSVVKSKVILGILQQAKEKYGKYSLDHLFEASDEDAMREMLAFQGVGPKTASCVLLFCLRRDSFAVDTHVYRITGLLGWRPKDKECTREQAQAHLDARVPREDKYGLHILLVSHGKACEECKAGGKSVGKCKLRNAVRGARIEG